MIAEQCKFVYRKLRKEKYNNIKTTLQLYLIDLLQYF